MAGKRHENLREEKVLFSDRARRSSLKNAASPSITNHALPSAYFLFSGLTPIPGPFRPPISYFQG